MEQHFYQLSQIAIFKYKYKSADFCLIVSCLWFVECIYGQIVTLCRAYVIDRHFRKRYHQNLVSFQILNNLLEIVQDRAEAAEDELERLLTELNEGRSSSLSSDKSPPNTNASADTISEGSDEVFEGSTVDKPQASGFWEVRGYLDHL